MKMIESDIENLLSESIDILEEIRKQIKINSDFLEAFGDFRSSEIIEFSKKFDGNLPVTVQHLVELGLKAIRDPGADILYVARQCGDVITARNLMRYNSRRWPTANDARAALIGLSKRGFGEWDGRKLRLKKGE